MRPSSTMSFEPGLDRGVPWGRDLFTFVTSAAGHMMRTLQKPRKNKPSKRQVNHRRFLHNMIQRKFAEIEAANQQLASALFSADTSQSQSEMKSSHKNEVKNLRNATADSCETETPPKQQDKGNDCRTLNTLVVNPETSFLKSKVLNHLNSGEGSQTWEGVEQFEHSRENSPQTTDFSCEREQIQSTAADLDNLAQVTNIILEESVFSWLESTERRRQNSDADTLGSPDVEQQYLGIALFDMSPTSAAVSPFSLDSCDFEEQMHQDGDHSSEMQHVTESFQVDVMENLELLDSMEGYLQSHHGDQRNLASVWHMQSEEDQSYFQDNLTFFNTSHEGCVMDNQTDCAVGVITGLEAGSQVTMLQESSVKALNVEHDLIDTVACSLAPCGSSCHQNQTRYADLDMQIELTKDCYQSQSEPDINITVSKEDQFSACGSWSMSEKNLKDLEQCNFADHSIDDQVLQRLEHGHPNHALTKYWDQQHVLTDVEKNIIQTETTLCPNSVYDSPPGPVSLSTAQWYGLGMPALANNDCRGESCSYSSCDEDGSIPSFEGVAQSFPAPARKLHPKPVSTPPLNEDWLFSNIIAEVDFTGMVRSAKCTYC
ncbi:hypothetical protein MHYP_G00023200 [Metynnis hypsauchen]